MELQLEYNYIERINDVSASFRKNVTASKHGNILVLQFSKFLIKVRHNVFLFKSQNDARKQIFPFLESHETAWECKNLEHLDLSSNSQLREIPPGIHGARKLKTLNVENCCLQQLPDSWNCPLVCIQIQLLFFFFQVYKMLLVSRKEQIMPGYVVGIKSTENTHLKNM